MQEDRAKASLIEQRSILSRRMIHPGGPGEPVDRQNKRLIVYRDREVSIVGAECSGAYGKPVELFERFWILAGSYALFIVDRIRASKPVSTVWNWVVNNRDGKTGTRMQDNSLEILRGKAGLKLFHSGNGALGYPAYGYMHDAYHVRPAQAGEGRPGSGLVFRFTENESALTRTVVHAIALDTPGSLAEWRMKQDNGYITLESPGEAWTLGFPEDAFLSLVSGNVRRDIRKTGEKYHLYFP